jgi:hypothetical protein
MKSGIRGQNKRRQGKYEKKSKKIKNNYYSTRLF